MLSQLPRRQKRIFAMVFDTLVIWFSIWLALSLRLGEFYRFSTLQLSLLLIATVIALPLFRSMGLYHAVIRYVSFRALWTVFKAVSIFAFGWGSIAIALDFGIPRSTPGIVWALLLIFIGGSRIIGRWYFAYMMADKSAASEHKKVLVYGAGDAGVQLVRALTYAKNMEPIAFVDDNEMLANTLIEGYRVHPLEAIGELIPNYGIDEVLLAVPSATISRRQQIIQNLEKYPVLVRSLPSIDALATGSISVNDIQEIDLDDLLGRDQVEPDTKLLQKNIRGKVVMVTGAGGSIGSELCRQIGKESPRQLILFEQHEYSLYSLENALLKDGVECVALLGSVTNQDQLERIMVAHDVQTIYHAAAYKHVPMVESNPAMGVWVNVFGTLATVRAATQCGVENMVLISTDKAVRPTNIMGATKRFAEMILQAYANEDGDTNFTMVRFGNVIGSSGSVVPLFREQIKNGGPVTVTHAEITRYFMTISEAVQLVIQAGAMSSGGDVFVLDMGQPVKIDELARRMIRLSGYSVIEKGQEGDIEIKYSGLRPGEKLYEELLIGENVKETDHPRIRQANEQYIEFEQLQKNLLALEKQVARSDTPAIVKSLAASIDGYQPDRTFHKLLQTQ